MSNSFGNLEQQTINKLENSSREEAKKIILDMISPECRDVGDKFFACVEEKTSGQDFSTVSFEKLESDLNDKYIPDCMSKHNLEECLNK